MTILPFPPAIALILGIVVASALLYGTLSLMQRKREAPMWESLSAGWLAILVPLALVWIALFLLTIAAVFVGTWRMIHEAEAATLGLGGLIAAMLGAPFLIWGTVLKHQTVRWAKEGHMTDRISKAVEQLGAEKKVDRIGRSVTLLSGQPVVFTSWTHAETEPALRENEEIVRFIGEDIRVDDEHNQALEWEFEIKRWPEKRTEIEWRGTPLAMEPHEKVLEPGDWQAFSESLPNLEVRIGAILSLERIAQDSTTHDKGRDHVRVMEVLCAYIRENAPASEAKDHPYGIWEPLKEDPTDEERAAHQARRKERFGGSYFSSLVYNWAQTLPPPA